MVKMVGVKTSPSLVISIFSRRIGSHPRACLTNNRNLGQVVSPPEASILFRACLLWTFSLKFIILFSWSVDSNFSSKFVIFARFSWTNIAHWSSKSVKDPKYAVSNTYSWYVIAPTIYSRCTKDCAPHGKYSSPHCAHPLHPNTYSTDPCVGCY